MNETTFTFEVTNDTNDTNIKNLEKILYEVFSNKILFSSYDQYEFKIVFDNITDEDEEILFGLIKAKLS